MANAYLGVFHRWLDRRYAERSNVELLRAYVTARDEAAFQTLVARYAEFVYGVCRRGTAQRALAEDAFQQTFAELARYAARIRTQEALGAWLRTTARRVSWRLRWRERLHRHLLRRPIREAVSTQEAPSVAAGLVELLDQLPAMYAGPLRLHYLGGRTIKEVGDDLRITESAARKRIERGLAQLRRRAAHPEVLAALGTAGLPETARALTQDVVRNWARTALQEGAAHASSRAGWLPAPTSRPKSPGSPCFSPREASGWPCSSGLNRRRRRHSPRPNRFRRETSASSTNW